MGKRPFDEASILLDQCLQAEEILREPAQLPDLSLYSEHTLRRMIGEIRTRQRRLVSAWNYSTLAPGAIISGPVNFLGRILAGRTDLVSFGHMFPFFYSEQAGWHEVLGHIAAAAESVLSGEGE